MTDINKQKFLAEFGRLLTFMTDEARHDVLAMYGAMFDEASDEQSLLQLLVSPTRQAVLIARAYNSKGGRLTAVADQDGDGTPEYAEVIGKIRQEAVERGVIAEKDKPLDQISIFDDSAAAAGEETAEQTESAEPAEEQEKSEEHPAELSFDEDGNIVFGNLDDDKDAAAEEGKPEEKAAEKAEEEESLPIPPFPFGTMISEENETDGLNAAGEEDSEPRRKPKILLLLVYILFAVPLTLAALAVMLVPTFLSLALAGLFGCLGVIAITAAFGGGFAMFANILVVLGVAAMLLALSLLFLWIFIWFIGSAMVSLVNGVISLGRKWCYKEVQAE